MRVYAPPREFGEFSPRCARGWTGLRTPSRTGEAPAAPAVAEQSKLVDPFQDFLAPALLPEDAFEF
jgi:hypothetical protein